MTFGGLDNCSAFKFENCLKKIRRMVRSGRCPLSQVVKRWIQKDNLKKKAIKIPVGENIIFMAILHDIAVSVYYHSNFLYRHNNSLLYQINLPVLDYRMLASSNFLGKTLLVYWPVIGLQKREKEGGGKEGIFDMSLMSKMLYMFCKTILFSISEDMQPLATPQAHTEGKTKRFA